MSPFDLRGPEFLLFYTIFGICALTALYAWRHYGEPDDPPGINLSDPYVIAFLRGGKNELLRVGTVTLIDRGLLEVSDDLVSQALGKSAETLRFPIERKIFKYFKARAQAASIFSSHAFDGELEVYERELRRLELLPSTEVQKSRGFRGAVVMAILLAVAVVKIVIALQRGRTNILFLILLASLFAVLAVKIAFPRLTRRGKAALDDLRTLFGTLKDRASTLVPNANPNEVLLMAAVFGLATVPATLFPHAKKLYPKAVAATNGCGSSCGASCGSSCGGGCGGGGCGGGCGGCGS